MRICICTYSSTFHSRLLFFFFFFSVSQFKCLQFASMCVCARLLISEWKSLSFQLLFYYHFSYSLWYFGMFWLFSLDEVLYAVRMLKVIIMCHALFYRFKRLSCIFLMQKMFCKSEDSARWANWLYLCRYFRSLFYRMLIINIHMKHVILSMQQYFNSRVIQVDLIPNGS